MSINLSLGEIFEYNPIFQSGVSWKTTRKIGKYDAWTVCVKGEQAGYKKKNTGYWHVKRLGKALSCHRVVYCLHNPDFDYYSDLVIDHIDGDKDNNRIENLRAVTHAENNRNRSLSPINKSGISGLTLTTCKNGHSGWRATISLYGKRKSKYFSILKYNDDARMLAEEWLKNQRAELSKDGINFTYRPKKESK